MTVNQALKKVNIKHVAYWIAGAWDDIKGMTNRKSQKHYLFGLDETPQKEPENANV